MFSMYVRLGETHATACAKCHKARPCECRCHTLQRRLSLMFQQLARGVRLLKTGVVVEGESIAEFSQLSLRVREGLWIMLCNCVGSVGDRHRD